MIFQHKSSGIVDSTDGKILFCNDHYEFTFLTNKLMPSDKSYTTTVTDDFLYMTSHKGKKMAFYYPRESFSISGDCKYHASLYLEADVPNPDADLSHFYKITFVGGVLNELWQERSLKVAYSKDGYETELAKDTIRKCAFSTSDFSCNISIGLERIGRESMHSHTIENQVYFSLEFDEEQPLKTINKHYKQVKRLISIMTYMEETHFDSIRIYLKRNYHNPVFNRAYVYLLENDNGKLPAHYYRNVSFDDLGESIGEVLSLFYNSQNKKPSYALGYIPRNEEEQWLITENTVRALFSALECEISFNEDVKAYETKELHQLCENVKQMVKKHREDHKYSPVLSRETYDLIFGSIDHWSISSYDKILLLFNRHREAIGEYQKKRSLKVTEENIHEFVKYRNSVTHGNYLEMSTQIRETAQVMSVLVFCCLLSRVGVSEEKIIQICDKKIWL